MARRSARARLKVRRGARMDASLILTRAAGEGDRRRRWRGRGQGAILSDCHGRARPGHPGPENPTADLRSAAPPPPRFAWSPSPASRVRSGRLSPRLHLGGVILHQHLGHVPGLETPRPDLRHRRDLGGGAGDEAFLEVLELVRQDAALTGPRSRGAGRGRSRFWRVMPSRKQSAIGVWTSPSLMKNTLAPVHSATRPCQSSISASA